MGVHSWVLPDIHELIQSYDTNFNIDTTFNIATLSKFIKRLSSYKLSSDISLSDTGGKINFIKHVSLKVFILISRTTDLKQAVFQH